MALQGEAIQLRFPSTHRTDVMIEDQVSKVQDAQSSLVEAMISVEEAESEEDRQSYLQQVESLHKRCNEMVVLLRVMIKVRTELGFSKLDLEAARKSGKNVRSCQKRVSWLEERLDKLLMSRQQRGRQKTRRLRHVAGGGHADSSLLGGDHSRTRTETSAAAAKPARTRHGDGEVDSHVSTPADIVVVASHPSAALRKAANLLTELRRNCHEAESSISTLASVPSADETLTFGMASDGSDGDNEDDDNEDDDFDGLVDEEDDDYDGTDLSSEEEDEEEDSFNSNDGSSDQFSSSAGDYDDDDDGDDESDTSEAGESASSAATDSRTEASSAASSSPPSSQASSTYTGMLSVITTPKVGIQDADDDEQSAMPSQSHLPPASPRVDEKPSVSFLTEPTVPEIDDTSISARGILKKPNSAAGVSKGVSLPPIQQFVTAGMSPTPSKDEIVKELQRRAKARPKQHAGCAEKPFRTAMQFGPVDSMDDPFSWQTIGLALPHSLVSPAYKRVQITTPPPDHTIEFRDVEASHLQNKKFNRWLDKVEDIETQMQYAGQFSADSKLPPLTLQSVQMSHSNKLALAKSCGVHKPRQKSATASSSTAAAVEDARQSPAPPSRATDSRASDTISVLEGLEDSRSGSPELGTGYQGQIPKLKFTMLKRNAPVYPTPASSFLRGKEKPRPAISLASHRAHQAAPAVKAVHLTHSDFDTTPRPDTPLLMPRESHVVHKNWRGDDEYGRKTWRLRTLLGGERWMNSPNPEERQSAAKEIGELGFHDRFIVEALVEKVADPHFIVSYQASRSLLLLGEWNEAAGKVAVQFLEHGSDEAKLDLLDVMIRSHQGTRVLWKDGVAECLDHALLGNFNDGETSAVGFRAAHCLALMHRGKTRERVVDYLHAVVEHGTEELERVQALDSLYKNIKVPGMKLFNSYMKFLFNATVAKHRLLSVIRIECIAKEHSLEASSHPGLEQKLCEKLWNDSNRHVCLGAARVLKLLSMQELACKGVKRQLESEKETARVQGVRSMCALRMRARAHSQILIDLVRMDRCQSVQLAAVRAFAAMRITDSNAVRLLKSKASCDGPLKQEAIRALEELNRT